VTARPLPTVSLESEPFWAATRDRRLVLQWCANCDATVQFPRSFCPRCQQSSLEWREASGSGTVYAVTVEHRPEAMGEEKPYAVALVDLDEGARFMTNVVGCEPDAVAIGMAVRVTWEELEDGRNLPQFKPSTASPSESRGT
jgi:uncharacterized OB-fold protein